MTQADKDREAERKAKLEKKEEAKQNINKKGDWTNDEIALLTKGIARYPPGTINRWKVIADFVGSKNMKEVVSKAKEIQEKIAADIESQRQVEEEKRQKAE